MRSLLRANRSRSGGPNWAGQASCAIGVQRLCDLAELQFKSKKLVSRFPGEQKRAPALPQLQPLTWLDKTPPGREAQARAQRGSSLIEYEKIVQLLRSRAGRLTIMGPNLKCCVVGRSDANPYVIPLGWKFLLRQKKWKPAKSNATSYMPCYSQ